MAGQPITIAFLRLEVNATTGILTATQTYAFPLIPQASQCARRSHWYLTNKRNGTL